MAYATGVVAALLIGGQLVSCGGRPLQQPPLDPVEPPAENAGWKPVELVSRNQSDSGSDPTIATGPGGTQFVVWVEKIAIATGPVQRLYFAQRAAGPAQAWSTPSVVTDVAIDYEMSIEACPSLAADNRGGLHLAWNGRAANGNAGVYVSRYGTQTGAWEPPAEVASDRPATCPKLVSDAGGDLHLAWVDSGNVNYRRFNRALGGWGEPLRLSSAAENFSAPEVSVGSDGAVYVAWVARSDGRYTLHLRQRRPNEPWGAPMAIATNSPTASCGASQSSDDRPAEVRPVIAADKNGMVHLLWTHEVCRRISGSDVSETHIYYRRHSEDSGWTPVELISRPSPPGRADRHADVPALAVSHKAALTAGTASVGASPELHVVWRENTYTWSSGHSSQLWYRRYDAAAAQWSPPQVVHEIEQVGFSTRKSLVSPPAMSLDASRFRGVALHVTWSEPGDRLNSGADWDIFYLRYLHSTGGTIEPLRDTQLPID